MSRRVHSCLDTVVSASELSSTHFQARQNKLGFSLPHSYFLFSTFYLSLSLSSLFFYYNSLYLSLYVIFSLSLAHSTTSLPVCLSVSLIFIFLLQLSLSHFLSFFSTLYLFLSLIVIFLLQLSLSLPLCLLSHLYLHFILYLLLQHILCLSLSLIFKFSFLSTLYLSTFLSFFSTLYLLVSHLYFLLQLSLSFPIPF